MRVLGCPDWKVRIDSARVRNRDVGNAHQGPRVDPRSNRALPPQGNATVALGNVEAHLIRGEDHCLNAAGLDDQGRRKNVLPCGPAGIHVVNMQKRQHREVRWCDRCRKLRCERWRADREHGVIGDEFHGEQAGLAGPVPQSQVEDLVCGSDQIVRGKHSDIHIGMGAVELAEDGGHGRRRQRQTRKNRDRVVAS